MTAPGTSSYPKPLKTTKKGEKFITLLKEKKVNTDNLCILMMPGELQLLGEVDELRLNEPVLVKNPKRFARFQNIIKTPQGDQVALNFMVGDLDLITGGEIIVSPVGGYFFGSLNEESIEAYLALYDEFLTRREENMKKARAEEAGIWTPPGAGMIKK